MEELEDIHAKEAERAIARIKIDHLKKSIASGEKYIKRSKARGVGSILVGCFNTSVAMWLAYSAFKELNAEQVNYAMAMKDTLLSLPNALCIYLNFYIFKDEMRYREHLKNQISKDQHRLNDLEKKLTESS